MRRLTAFFITLCIVLQYIPIYGYNDNFNTYTEVIIADDLESFSKYSSELISNDNFDEFSKGFTVTSGAAIEIENNEGISLASADIPEAVGIDGVIMAPLEVLADEAGAKTVYDSKTNNTKIQKEDIEIVLEEGSNTALVDDTEKSLSVSPYNENGSIMVPVEDIAESLGYDVEEQQDGSLFLTRPFQTKRIIVKTSLEIDYYNAAKVIKGFNDLYVLQYDAEKDAEDAINKYLNDKNIIYAQPDRMVYVENDTKNEFEYTEENGRKKVSIRLDTPEEIDTLEEIDTPKEIDAVEQNVFSDSVQGKSTFSESSHLSWGAEKIQCDSFNENLSQNNEEPPEIVVGVLDTGIDSDHEFLIDRIIPYNKNFVAENDGSKDVHGHGTFVSGIITDVTMPNVKIMPFKVLNNEGMGSDLSVYNGMIDASKQNVDVINMSLGGWGKSALEEEAVSKAYEKNIPIIAAAGNESDDVSDYSPAGIDDVITVSALEQDNRFAYFSNYGEKIDVSAPGVNINSAQVGGGYSYGSGTSAAAPFVSGAAAMLKSYNKDMSISRINEILKQSAFDLGSPGWDKYFGDGIINLADAWFVIDDNSIPTPVFSVKGGDFTESFELTLTCSDPEAKIYYSIDGNNLSNTSENSYLYEKPIKIDKSITIIAVAYKDDKKSLAKIERFYLNGYDLEENFDFRTEIVNDEEIYVLDSYRGYLNTVKIPEKIQDKKVCKISTKAFSKSTSDKVIIPKTINDIGQESYGNAFTSSQISEIIVDEGNQNFSSSDGVLFSKDKTKLIAYPPKKEDTVYQIPENITNIEKAALARCNNLTEINIPSGVTYIDESNPFMWCNGLYSINVDSQNNSFCSVDGVLYNKAMTKLIMCPLNKLINQDAGERYSFDIPDGVVDIGDYALVGGTVDDVYITRPQIAEITIPNSVTTIGNYVFYGCWIGKPLIIPESVTNIGEYAFAYTSADIDFKAQIKELKSSTFRQNYALKYITLPDCLESIEDSVFYFCYNLKSIVIPKNVHTIGIDAFWRCEALTEAYFEGNAPKLPENGQNIFGNPNQDFKIYYYKGAEGFTTPKWNNYNTVELDRSQINTVSFIYNGNLITTRDYATGEYIGTLENMPQVEGKVFDGWCTDEELQNEFNTNTPIMDSMTLYAKYVTFLNDSDFTISVDGFITGYSGTKEELFIPTILNGIRVRGILNYAFLDNNYIKTVEIDNGCEYIIIQCFCNCYSLESINLPASLSSFSGNCIYNCKSLKNIYVDENNPDLTSENGVVYNKDKTKIIAYPPGKEDKEFVVQEGVKEIGESTFEECSNLTSITIPESVTNIEERAFLNCSSLTNITIPEGVTSIGNFTFFGCSSLTDITIPESVTSIGYTAFSRCSSLTGITIPEGVTNIEINTFYNCSSLTSITIPESVTSIGDSAFNSCSSLKTAYFEGNAPEQFGEYVFDYCAPDFTIIYNQNASGFTTPKWNGYNTRVKGTGDDTANSSSTESTTESTTLGDDTTNNSSTESTTESITSGDDTANNSSTEATTESITSSASGGSSGSSGGSSSGGGGGGGGGSSLPSYTVKFDSNNGSTVESQKVVRNDKLTKPSEPIRDGYTFTGWYTDKKCTKKYDFSAKVTSSFTLYAGWNKNKTDETIKDDTPKEDVPKEDVPVAETNEENNTAADDVRVTIGNEKVKIAGKEFDMGVAPYIQPSSNSTLVPLRFVVLAICGDDVENADTSELVAWDTATKTATITANNRVIKFTAGSNVMFVDDKTMMMDNSVKAEIKDSRMFIPFRALGEALGVDVDWDADTKTAIYKTK